MTQPIDQPVDQPVAQPMKQLLILSGKGGTGKTTVASAFIALSKTPAFADCDVDAPNLHISTHATAISTISDFHGMPRAQIDSSLCISCGLCQQSCRFDAISESCGAYSVDRIACEGCTVCQLVCPVEAIEMTPEVTGCTIVHADAQQIFSTARLKAGAGNSGKLVSQVKRNLLAGIEGLELSTTSNQSFAVIDGSPGIGCPVIASLAAIDMVLVVSEPTISGVSDLERVLAIIGRFNLPAAVCVNKADLDEEQAVQVVSLCDANRIPFVGSIPYNHAMAKAISEGQVPRSEELEMIYERTVQLLFR